MYNIIRAANPQPAAWTRHGEIELAVFDAALEREPPAREGSPGEGVPGEVLAIDDDGFVVAAGNGAIRIKRVRADAGKIPAAEYATSNGLAVGDRLG